MQDLQIVVIDPSVEFIGEHFFDYSNALKFIELCGRTCYKSENKITADSAAKFVKMITDKHHLSVIEHVNYTVKIICDRSTSHQLVRHRIASYSQESQRFVNYAKKNEFVVVKPVELDVNSQAYEIWLESVRSSIYTYTKMLDYCKPEIARSVLPNAMKTEIVVTMNLRQWLHVFSERLSSHAQADIRFIMQIIKNRLSELFPPIFS